MSKPKTAIAAPDDEPPSNSTANTSSITILFQKSYWGDPPHGRVKAIEFQDDGKTLKRIEYYE